MALALACSGAMTLTSAAGASPTGRAATSAPAPAPALAPAGATAASCAADPQAQGQRGGAYGELVSVPRGDGRVEQFRTFSDPTATGPLPFVWQRSQPAPGAAYGDWVRVSAATVGPKSYAVTGIENAAGGIELLWSTYGAFCHSALPAAGTGTGTGWTTPDAFGLQPAPYHGAVTLHRRFNGTILAIASSNLSGRSAASRTLYAADAANSAWQPVTGAGAVTESGVGLGQPEVVAELPDRRVKVRAREWNRGRYWTLTEEAPDFGRPAGWWRSQWTLCETPACT